MSELVMKKSKKITSTSLDFIKDNILSISDLTRTSKLSEILNMYAGTISDEVFVIKNNKVKDAVGVLVDYERFVYLIKVEEILEKSIDNYMYKIAFERKNKIDLEKPVSLSEIVQEGDFDFNSLIANLEKFDLDEE